MRLWAHGNGWKPRASPIASSPREGPLSCNYAIDPRPPAFTLMWSMKARSFGMTWCRPG